jgi:alpha-glucosidase (family GH31 glycosyl hydrolase)
VHITTVVCRHYTYPRGLENPYGVKVEGWTGHTVYPYLFPEPVHFLSYLRRRNVFVTFNHHPAAGVEFHDEAYNGFARALGQNPPTGQTIAFDIANYSWSDKYFEHVIKPIDDMGMQYWWLDFQQQPFTSVPLLNPTIMCNYAWWNNAHRYGDKAPVDKATDRPYLMGRFGGLGAHRYPYVYTLYCMNATAHTCASCHSFCSIGFVGDTYVKWDVLRFETYFMPTASNVGYQWTHDIGGFEGYSPPEFFARHVQFGTFSPVCSSHYFLH